MKSSIKIESKKQNIYMVTRLPEYEYNVIYLKLFIKTLYYIIMLTYFMQLNRSKNSYVYKHNLNYSPLENRR